MRTGEMVQVELLIQMASRHGLNVRQLPPTVEAEHWPEGGEHSRQGHSPAAVRFSVPHAQSGFEHWFDATQTQYFCDEVANAGTSH